MYATHWRRCPAPPAHIHMADGDEYRLEAISSIQGCKIASPLDQCLAFPEERIVDGREMKSSPAPLRRLRALLLTGLVFSLSAAGHLIGGGALPEPGPAAVMFALLLQPVMLLTTRRLSFGALLAVLVTGQAVLHQAFMVFSPMAHHGPMPGTYAMSAGHLAAAVVIAWFLSRNEAAVWQLLAWLRPLVAVPVPAVVPARPPLVFIRNPILVPSPWRNIPVNSLRGPPACAGAPPARSA